ncbi:FAD/NAD(P)-binding domain-containing protein [Podospora fimiseda]|uniref:FAD/NAD(P)-binding domain-containing protein n=1 Tax=Podospora fimiseda TaxID=252190 RepID=A0AAN7BJ22_9PEZI|nr:FAD/NAD(P)-binding domain-containing protein [Podospora fimiseda]
MTVNNKKPILIIGSGISGLLLAQHLRKLGSDIPFEIFERDTDLTTRGLGWGLTLHWSLPAIRSLLPEDLFLRLPEAYVDRVAVQVEGRASTFPFFDLSTGELKAATPKAAEGERIRVTRDKFRRLLATGLDIQWGKAATSFITHNDGSVTVNFEDGTSHDGTIVVACDGGNSRIRQQLFPDHQKHQLPIRLMGLKLDYTPEQIEPLRKLDPYFLQGCASQNDSFVYFSTLNAQGNTQPPSTHYTTQLAISWPVRPNFFSSPSPIPFPTTNPARLSLIKSFASTWSDPFKSLALSIPENTEIKCLELSDWVPPKNFRTKGSVALLGDAMHPMVMYRGEGANHAIVDVLEFVEEVLPYVYGEGLRDALDRFEDKVVPRVRAGVLASRQACYDAHQWDRISGESPLLSRRAMRLEFGEEDLVEPEWE